MTKQEYDDKFNEIAAWACKELDKLEYVPGVLDANLPRQIEINNEVCKRIEELTREYKKAAQVEDE